MEKLTSAAYEFDVTKHSTGGFTIVLTQVATGATKIFKQAGGGNGESLFNHMLSLTDSQCEQWFNVAKKPKKEKHRTEPTVTDSGLIIPAINRIVPSTVPTESVKLAT